LRQPRAGVTIAGVTSRRTHDRQGEDPPRRQSVRFRGRDYPVRDRLRVGGRDLLVLRRMSRSGRSRLLVWDPRGGSVGMRLLTRLDADLTNRDRVRTLERLADASPSFPQLLECRREGDQLYVVMSWVDGDDLAYRLRGAAEGRRPAPSVHDAWKLYRSLAHALVQMHQKTQLVHGDVRPENLIITRKPERLVVVDFGAAWRVERTGARGEGDGLSPTYAAPEQQRGDAAVDWRADQFAAAVVGYQLLTGETPYDKLGGRAGVVAPHTTLTPPSRRLAGRGDAPRRTLQAIDECLTRSLAFDPSERFVTGGQWLAAVDAAYRRLREDGERVAIRGWNRALLDLLLGLLGGGRPPRGD